jgi:hypothetical protein
VEITVGFHGFIVYLPKDLPRSGDRVAKAQIHQVRKLRSAWRQQYRDKATVPLRRLPQTHLAICEETSLLSWRDRNKAVVKPLLRG